MAQKDRSTATAERTGQGEANRSSSGPISHLGPAAKHPLRLSPFSTQATDVPISTTRRRRRQEGSQYESEDNTNGDGYLAKGKDDYDRPKVTTLDKLEGWLGLSSGEGSKTSQSAATTLTAPVPSSSSNRTPKPKTSRTTRLVVVHSVSPNDSLDSLALRFNTDARSLRKCNGLWPGDSVQVKKEIYIPVDDDYAARHESNIVQANEGLGGKLMLLDSLNGGGKLNGKQHPGRTLSTTSASSVSAASYSHSNHTAQLSPEVRRMPCEALSYFPPPGSNAVVKGKGKQEDAFGFGEGMKPERDVDHGESGVDDLLQLAEKARSRGSSPPRTDTEAVAKSLVRVQTPSEAPESISPSSSARALEEPWKPNKWTFGQKKAGKQPAAPSPTASNASLPEIGIRGPAMFPSSNYQGWNDIPEPPLHRTAKGQVAHAYKGASKARRYPRPGGVMDLTNSGAIIEDLTAGLLPNSGPASNWARPIAESVPLPGDASKDALRRSRAHPLPSQANSGWAQMLSDTVRGKIGLEEAFERGLEDMGFFAVDKSNHATTRGPHRARSMLLQQAAANDTPPLRPSAEMARVTLGEGQLSARPEEGLQGPTNGMDLRRDSGRSMHELQDLDENKRKDWSSTWAAPSAAGSEGNARGRKNIRNVDWLG